MKKFFAVLFSFLMILSLNGCGKVQPGLTSHTDVAMGTVINLKIYSTDNKNYAEEVMGLLRELEEKELSVRAGSSEAAYVNANAGSDAVPVSAQFRELIGRCLEVGDRSDGALDVTLGNVVKLWNIDFLAGGEAVDFQLPDESALESALASCGNDKIGLSEERDQISLRADTALDLGAVGKGIALDRVRAYLQEQDGITGAVISVGGSVLTYGSKPDGTDWKVGITDPFDTGKVLGYLTLAGTHCISTSGDYERYVEKDGVRYHHIIDPHTGYPARSGLSSVTILSEDGFLSDALSTACFVLGSERGLTLATEYGCEALFVTTEGELLMTEGFRQLFGSK